MVRGADPTREADEARGDGVADPDAEPRLPPRQARDDHGARDHPGVYVERVSDPEAHEVPGPPLAALGLDGLEVEVGEHELGGGQARLVVDGELVTPSPEAGSPALVHGCCSGGAAVIAEESVVVSGNSWFEEGMEPGRQEVSGGKQVQARGESGDKTTDCRCVRAQEAINGGEWMRL